MNRLPRLTPALLLITTLACVTVNVYFPEAAIKELSQQIEEEVQRQAADEIEPQGASTTRRPSRALAATSLSILALATPALAAQEEVAPPEVTNPAIRKIIEARAQRLEALDRYKTMGVLGENNQALLELRSLDPVADLRQRAEVQRLLKAENEDRTQLFKEIAAAKGVDLTQLPRIQETYAETLREKARPGDWIQRPDGSWAQKTAGGSAA
jgi:uncharacterized protein YdbL (DUF1318 family)